MGNNGQFGNDRKRLALSLALLRMPCRPPSLLGRATPINRKILLALNNQGVNHQSAATPNHHFDDRLYLIQIVAP
jgi:hypothetical protein